MLMSGIRRTSSVFATIAVTTLLFSSMACKDEGVGLRQVPQLSISPASFIFPKLTEGASEERSVQIRNLGEGPLRIANFESGFNEDFSLYFYEGDEVEHQGKIIAEAGVIDFDHVIEVAPHDLVTLILNYQPSNDRGASGTVRFQTNDPDNADVEIEITASRSGAEINVINLVDFGPVPVGEEETRPVTITNVGQAVLTFEQMRVNGDQDFSLSLKGGDPVQDSDLLNDPDGDGNPGLSSGASFVVDVNYLTEVEGPDEAQFSIISSDPDRHEVAVTLIANGNAPCIRVVPGELEFGAALTGRVTARPISIESCGGDPLQIIAIQMADDSAEVFTVDESSVPEWPANLPAQTVGEPAPSRNITINFAPDAEEAYAGKVIITSNAVNHPEKVVPVIGRGTINECPVAVVAQDTFNVVPLDIITLDGGQSTDTDGPGGRPVTYEWTVIDKPDGSTAEPMERFADLARPADSGRPDDTSTPLAHFFVDLAGTYTIALHVTDQLDLVAPSEQCVQPDAVVQIEARPNEDIHVQLVWSTPSDPDETDLAGTDIDLHFLYPGARSRWNVAPFDCYYGNTTPDWGPAGIEGNPSLDIDDTNGAGPENINLDHPADTNALGGVYRVGAHYYRAENSLTFQNMGASDVTVRIYLSGVLAGEWVRRMQATHHFWTVAGIIWTQNDHRIQEINDYAPDFP